MRDINGQLTFFVYVNLVDASEKCKRVRLHSVWCERGECAERLAAFQAANRNLAGEVFAHFVFEESVG